MSCILQQFQKHIPNIKKVSQEFGFLSLLFWNGDRLGEEEVIGLFGKIGRVRGLGGSSIVYQGLKLWRVSYLSWNYRQYQPELTYTVKKD